MKIKKNLIIIGMMGSGKSTIGSILAKNLDFEFIDTDTEIEKKESMKIEKLSAKMREIEVSLAKNGARDSERWDQTQRLLEDRRQDVVKLFEKIEG